MREGRLPEGVVDFLHWNRPEYDLGAKGAALDEALLDYRQASSRLVRLCRGGPPEDIEEQITLADAVSDARRCLEMIREHNEFGTYLFGSRWHDETSEWAALRMLSKWVVGMHNKIGEGRLPVGLIDFFADSEVSREDIEAKTTAVEEALVEQDKGAEGAIRALGLPDNLVP